MKLLAAFLIALFAGPLLFAYAGGSGGNRPSGGDTSDASGDDDGTADRGRGDSPSAASPNAGGGSRATAARDYSVMYGDKDCNTVATVKDRAICRRYSQNTRAEFIPEECRTVEGETQRALCIQKYRKLERCRNLVASTGEKNRCAMGELNLPATSNVAEQYSECRNATNKGECRAALKDKVYSMVKFRIYALEERAEMFAEKGIVTDERAAEFIAYLEDAKKRFNSASDLAGKIAVLKEVRTSWGKFVSEARQNYNAIREGREPPKPPDEGWGNSTNGTSNTAG